MHDTLETVDYMVTKKWNQMLLLPFAEEEVRRTLFRMHPSKAPVLDGMSTFFSQNYWHIVGSSVSRFVLVVLNSDHLLRKVNHTYIAMIP